MIDRFKGSRTMKLQRLVLLAAALVMIYSPPVFAANPYDINVVMPLSGGAAFLGRAEKLALQQQQKMLIKEGKTIGGRPVRFIFYDDQSSPQTAVQLATQLVAKHPAVVLGSAIVAMCNAMAPLMANGPVLYCTTPGIYPPPGSYVFSSSVSTHDLITAQLRYFLLRGWKRIAVLTSTDGSGQDAARNIKKILAQPEYRAIKVVADENFNPTTISASAQIQRIKGAHPQALIAWSTGAAIGTVFRAISEAGLTIPVATTDGNMTYAQMKQYASFLPKELFIPSPEWLPDAPKDAPPSQVKAKKDFYSAFQVDGLQPDAAASFAWDPAMLVISALRKIGPDATAAQVRNYLANIQGVAGVDGIYNFKNVPQRGLNATSVYITQWKPGRHKWIVVSKPGGAPL